MLMRHVFHLIVSMVLFFLGFVQTFWGNDPYLGWSISVITALVLAGPLITSFNMLPVAIVARQRLLWALLALILWISLGVGELFHKTALMIENFPQPIITGV